MADAGHEHDSQFLDFDLSEPAHWDQSLQSIYSQAEVPFSTTCDPNDLAKFVTEFPRRNNSLC